MKTSHSFCILFLIIFNSFTSNLYSAIITGSLLGYDNKPMQKADLLISNKTFYNIDTLLINTDTHGKFKINLLKKGYYEVRASGVNHICYKFLIYIPNNEDSIDCQINLSSFYLKNPSQILIFGNFNNYKSRKDTMKLGPDGKYYFEITKKFDSVKYQLLDLMGDNYTRNGTMSDSYELDPGGDYFSIIYPKSEKTIIVFDPNILSKSTSEKVTLTRNGTDYSEFWQIQQKLKLIEKDILDGDPRVSYSKNSTTKKKNLGAFRDTLKNILIDIKNEYQTFKFDESKKVALINYLKYSSTGFALNKFKILGIKIVPFDIDKDFIKIILAEIKPTDYEWTLLEAEPGTIFISSLIVSDSGRNAYFDDFIYNSPNNRLKLEELRNAYAFYTEFESNKSLSNYYSNLILTLFPDDFFSKELIKRKSKNHPLSAGNTIPEFEVQLVENPRKFLTDNDLKGKYTLIDIWATWCGPCVRGLPKIKQLYEKYDNKKFQILSISLDKTLETCLNFQKNKFPMPWLNTIEVKGFQSDLCKSFEISGIPQLILLDPELNIISSGEDLRGELLFETLDKYVQ